MKTDIKYGHLIVKKDLHDKVAELAKRERLTIDSFIYMLITKYVKSKEKK